MDSAQHLMGMMQEEAFDPSRLQHRQHNEECLQLIGLMIVSRRIVRDDAFIRYCSHVAALRILITCENVEKATQLFCLLT